MAHISYRLVIAGLVSSSMLASVPADARRKLIPDLPSVEVNLEVLQSLKGQEITYGDPTAVPFAPMPVSQKPIAVAVPAAPPARGPQGYIATYESSPVPSRPKTQLPKVTAVKTEPKKEVAKAPPPTPAMPKQIAVIPPPPPPTPASPSVKIAEEPVKVVEKVQLPEQEVAALPEPDLDDMEMMPFPDMPKVEDADVHVPPVDLPPMPEVKADIASTSKKQETARDVLDALMDMPPREEPLPSEILADTSLQDSRTEKTEVIPDLPSVPEEPPAAIGQPSSIDPDIMAMLDKASDEQETLPPLELPDMSDAKPKIQEGDVEIPMPDLPPVTSPISQEPVKIIEEPPKLDALPPLPDMPEQPGDAMPPLPPVTQTDPKPVAPSPALPAAMPQEDDMPEIALPDLPPLPAPDVPPIPDVTPPNLPSLDALTQTSEMALPNPSQPDLPPLDAVTSNLQDEMEVAALPAQEQAPKANSVSPEKADLVISFTGTTREVSDADREKIAKVAASAKSTGRRIRVVGYASAPSSQASMARKTALARALAVRSLLISNQIPQMNITAQSQHLEIDAPNPERVDIILQ